MQAISSPYVEFHIASQYHIETARMRPVTSFGHRPVARM